MRTKQRTSMQVSRRAGAATIDYVLILAVVLPMVAFLMWAGPRMIRLAYDLTCLLIAWPFMQRDNCATYGVER